MMKLISMLIAAPLLVSLALPAAADPRDGWRDHGDRFERHDVDHWRGGSWRHGWHDGRIGWWWVSGGFWSFYPEPVYPYPAYAPPIVVQPPAATVVIQQPAPPVQIEQPAPPVQIEQPAPILAPAPSQNNWYYCVPLKAYYPYVDSCPSGWKVVPASPPPAPQ